MGVALCLFSSIFIIIGVGVALSTLKRWSWKEVPCQIESFEITHDRKKSKPFDAQILYSYRWDGREFTGSENNQNADYEKLVRVERRLSRRGKCYLDPDKPEEAILERTFGGVWFGLIFASVGALFFVIGLSIFKSKDSKSKAVSSKAKNKSVLTKGPGGFLFFGIFAIIGTALFLFLVVPTAKKFIAAKSWQPVEATVIWSTVRSHSSDDGTTYSPDIFYRYNFKGERHRSNSYALFSGSSSGSESKRKLVEAHPRGHKFTCYVNPDKPWQAVVERKLGWFALLGLFPLPFMAVGFGGLWWMIFRAGKKNSVSAAKFSGRKNTPNHLSTPTPIDHKPKTGGRWGKFFGHLFFALLWCGITGIFVFIAWQGWDKGQPEWFLTIFMIPFVLIGLFLLFSLPHTFLGIFSPHYDFDFRDPHLKPGLATKFSWKQNGGKGQLTEMTITLVGEERATYQRGTDRSTAESIFYQKEIFRTTQLTEMRDNDCDLIFPTDALPSFEGQHNQIDWFIQFHAAVHRRPDVKEDLPLILQPLDPSDFR